MSDSYIIEVGSKPAGIVVRDPDGYRFFAASPRFYRMEASYFATRVRPSTPRAGWQTADYKWHPKIDPRSLRERALRYPDCEIRSSSRVVK
jgi:hypothetical protein